MTAQEDIVERPNSFILLGIDIMLAEDYSTWLIEINTHPAMGPTTNVTKKMCRECLSDVIKGKRTFFQFCKCIYILKRHVIEGCPKFSFSPKKALR